MFYYWNMNPALDPQREIYYTEIPEGFIIESLRPDPIYTYDYPRPYYDYQMCFRYQNEDCDDNIGEKFGDLE